MTRIPRNQATGLEILAVFIGLGIFISLIPIEFRLFPPQFLNQFSMGLMAASDFSLTYLVLSCLMPTWGVVGLENFRLRQQAEKYADWWSKRHPLLEQRIECAVRAAYLALARHDVIAAAQYAETGLSITEHALDRTAIAFYYALCLAVRASVFQSEGRSQEALEDYSRATRLNLQPPSLTAQYYAQASGVLYNLGRFDEAILFSQQAIASEGCPAEFLALAHRSAALSLAELERYTEAVEHSWAGLAVRPFSWASAMLTADHYWFLKMAGETDAAAKHLELLETMMKNETIARLLKPEYEEVWARICMVDGRWEWAEALLRQSLKGTEGHAAQCYYLHALTLRRGDSAEAEKWRARLLSHFPQSFYASRLATEASAQAGSRV